MAHKQLGQLDVVGTCLLFLSKATAAHNASTNEILDETRKASMEKTEYSKVLDNPTNSQITANKL